MAEGDVRYGDRLLLAKVETTYGVDPKPVGTNAVRAKNLTRKQYAGNFITREYDTPSAGAREQLNAMPHSTFSFDVDLGPAKAVAGAPGYGVLLEACGFEASDDSAENVEAYADKKAYKAGALVTSESNNYRCIKAHTADASANKPGTTGGKEFWVSTQLLGANKRYTPLKNVLKSKSFTGYFFTDTDRQRMLGSRGTLSMTFETGAEPMASFEYTSFYDRPTTQTAITPDITAYQTAEPVTFANTPIVELFDVVDLPCASVNITQGNTVTFQNLINHREVYITAREMTLSIVISGRLVSNYNWLKNRIESHLGTIHKGRFKLRHGSISRHIVLTSNRMQLLDLDETDRDGLRFFTLTGRFLQALATTDDEFSIRFV